MLRSLLGWVVDFQDDTEPKGMLQAAAYGFFIMFSYYILRAVRDEISAEDRGNLQIIWTVVFFVMIFAVQGYSWIASRYSRGVFVPLANRFFIVCLIGFWASLVFLPEASRPWIDRVFYVWTSVFALFVVTVFWGLVADCFNNDQGKRLFGFIAIGSSVGGIVGSAVTAYLAVRVPVFALLLISCVPLEIASWYAGSLHRNFGTGSVRAVGEADRPLAGDAWSGMKAVFASPYLLGIAGFIALMTFASTILYFAQSDLVYAAMTDRGERTAFLARIDLVVNVLTILFELYLTARIIRWLGVGVTLALVPAAVAVGFLVLGLYPTLWTLVVVQVIYRAGRYGLAKPAREVLFTVVSREEKYKSKAFIDAAVYRGGDLVSGWAYAGFAAVGLTIGSIALVAAPLAAVWAVVGLRIGRRGETLATDLAAASEEAVPVG
ncbi:MAG: MFS transporter [Gemmatimonadetes bacterium]|nr:MFS transporter [Gemmatimonadota bacterium]MDA1103460.1 MFS transporter [Gemmatimonadota bacterium]